ncbi:MAG: hypothetical protein WDM78_12735 [Puia sp.]
MNGFELSVNLRFAFLEKFFETTFYRTSLGSQYPIIDVKYTHGFPGVLGSTLTYNKLFASISDVIKVPRSARSTIIFSVAKPQACNPIHSSMWRRVTKHIITISMHSA